MGAEEGLVFAADIKSAERLLQTIFHLYSLETWSC